MKIVQWRDWNPADDDIWLGLDDDVFGAWAPVFSSVPRPGTTAVYTNVFIGERTIGAEFGDDESGRTIEETWKLALQRLNPLDTSDGTLVIEFNDAPGVHWSCQAKLTQPAPLVEGTTDNFDITWETTDPRWHASSIVTESNVVTATAITNPSFATNTTGWTKGADPANITSAFTRETGTVYDGDGGAGELQISANTAVVNREVFVMNDTEFLITEGGVASIRAAVRSSEGSTGGSGGIYCFPVVRFYDAGDSVLQTNIGAIPTDLSLPVDPPDYPDDQWNIGVTGDDPAPAGTEYFKIGAYIRASPGETGFAFFDAFEFVTGPFTATPFTVDGTAPLNLTVKLTPAGNFPQSIVARSFTVTNNGTKTLHNHPFEVDLGDNSASDLLGTYSILLRDGRPQPCQVTDYDTVSAWCWFIIDHLPVGATANYTLLVSDQTVLPGQAHTFNSFTRPAFDIGFVYATTTSGSSSTVTNIPSGLGSEVDRWIGGTMEVLTGAQAGTTIELTDSSTTTVTHAALGGGALASGVDVLIKMSSNSRWVYPVRKTERSDSTRGLWWLSSGQKRPNDFRMDVPGSWGWSVYYDNDDEFSQSWNLPFDPGGGADYVAIFDAERTWQGGKTRGKEQGFDGVSIHTGVPITNVRFDYQLRNPNSMAMLVLGSRQENGATEWTHEYEDAAAQSTLSNSSIQNEALEADTYGVGLFLIPNGADQIDPGWAGDEGTTTSGSSTTLTDSSKEWIADQFIGGTIRIISGAGAGQSVAITDNTSTVITVASWPNGTPDSTSHYRIINRDYYAIARNHNYLHLTLDSSDIVASAVSAETDAYVLYRDVLVDDDQRVAINPETTGRYIVLLADESLVIDGEQMRAWVANTGTDEEIRGVPADAYSVLIVEADGTRRLAPRWLWVNPGQHTVSIADDESGVACAVDVSFREAAYA